MKISDLFTETETGRLSSTKVWTHIGNAAMTWAFVVTAWRGSLTEWFVLAYGGVVSGSYALSRWLTQRAGLPPNGAPPKAPPAA